MKKPPLVIISSVFVFLTAIAVLGVGLIALAFSGFGSTPNFLQVIALACVAAAVGIFTIARKFLQGRNWTRIVILLFTFVWSAFFIVISLSEQDYSNFMFAAPSLVAFVATLLTFFVRKEFFRQAAQ